MAGDRQPPSAQRRRLMLLTLHAAIAPGAVACSSGEGGRAPTSVPPSVPPPDPPVPMEEVRFPLHIEQDKHYLVDAAGRPFLIHGDTAWSLVGQLNDAQIDFYLDDRRARGFNTVLFSAPERYYTNQKPAWLNVDGVAPFAPMPDFASPNEAYWRRVDHVIDGAKARGMVCIVNPAYLGYEVDGWLAEVAQASDASLQAYGAWLARRYEQGNVIWCLGGDHDEPESLLRKQWNIAIGMRSVRTTDIITAHQMSDASNADDAYAYWNGYPGFNLNAVYGWETNGKFTHELCDQARSRPMPFLGFEFKYENAEGATLAMLRRQSYGALLSGACGQMYGNNPIWHFGYPQWNEPYSGTWQSHLGSPGAVQQTHLIRLFIAQEWWKLVPSTDGSLVASSLGGGTRRIHAARAHDGSFAMIYVPQAQSLEVRLSALSPSSVRGRFYDPAEGSWSDIAGTPFVNTGRVDITTPGERVIVLDAAT